MYVAETSLKRPQRFLNETEVRALELLPTSVQKELRWHIYRRHFESHPLLRFAVSVNTGMAETLVQGAVHFRFLQKSDDLFTPGASCNHAYRLARGVMNYVQDPCTSMVSKGSELEVPERSWLCEAALWTLWVHVGKCSAVEECQIFEVHADALLKSLRSHRIVSHVVSAFAKVFRDCVEAAKPPSQEYPSDVFVPNTEIASIVMSTKWPGFRLACTSWTWSRKRSAIKRLSKV